MAVEPYTPFIPAISKENSIATPYGSFRQFDMEPLPMYFLRIYKSMLEGGVDDAMQAAVYAGYPVDRLDELLASDGFKENQVKIKDALRKVKAANRIDEMLDLPLVVNGKTDPVNARLIMETSHKLYFADKEKERTTNNIRNQQVIIVHENELEEIDALLSGTKGMSDADGKTLDTEVPTATTSTQGKETNGVQEVDAKPQGEEYGERQ